MSNHWSLLVSYGWTKSFDNGLTAHPGQHHSQNALPATPNDEINTTTADQVYTRSNGEVVGHLEIAVLRHRASRPCSAISTASRSAAPSPQR